MKKEQPTKIAIITWEDPMTFTGWRSLGKSRAKHGAQTRSVGFLVSEDRDYVRIALDWNMDGETNGLGVIPRKSVKSMHLINITPRMLK